MKTFNKVIAVEVSLNSIAQNLLSKIEKSVVNADVIVETIMETIPMEKLQYLYNSLNGFSNEINVAIGEIFYCNHSVYYPYHPVVKSENRKDPYMHIGNCIVTDIDLYKNDKVEVECDYWTKNGIIQKERFWVRHQSLEVYRNDEPVYKINDDVSEPVYANVEG